MKIAYVTSEYVTEPGFSGGLSNYLGRICPELAARGHEIHVITRSTVEESIEADGVHVHRTVPWWHEKRLVDHLDPFVPRALYGPYQDVKAAWAVRRRYLELNQAIVFDLIQLTNVMAIGLFFRWERDTPVVLRLSSFKPECAAVNGVDSLAERVRLRLEKASVRQQGHSYAPSHYVADRVHEVYRCPKPAVLETPFYAEEKAEDVSLLDEVAQGRPYVLFFGQLSRLKGVVDIAEALPSLFERIEDFRIVLIGRDSATAPQGGSVREYLFRSAGDHSGRVHILEPQRHRHLYPFVRSARLVAIPSLVDNFPNTALEAMFFGRPVLATSGTSFEQLIDHERSGWLVPRNKATALADGLVRLWNLPENERIAMGARARARIDQLHPDITIPELLQYYSGLGGSRYSGPMSSSPGMTNLLKAS